MTWLTVGVVLWIVVHLFPAFAPDARKQLIKSIGPAPYRGLFSLLTLVALGAIIYGWRNTDYSLLYNTPPWASMVTLALMAIAVVFLLEGSLPGRSRWVRHPQLCGVAMWAVAHLASNGELQSVILFGGMLLWAVADIFLINRRDGTATSERPFTSLPLLLGSSVVVYALLFWAHAWLSGVALL